MADQQAGAGQQEDHNDELIIIFGFMGVVAGIVMKMGASGAKSCRSVTCF